MFIGLFYRAGSLRYTPGSNDQPAFFFFPDTTTPYTIRENRNFNTVGIKADYSFHPARELEFKLGTLTQFTSGREDFVTTSATGQTGPSSNSALKGYDMGGYAQTAYSPVEQFEIRTGLRYDAHNAPFAGTTTQLSPRIRLNFYPNLANTLYLYYGRLFVPTNVEDLRAITTVAQGGVAADPTVPERDNFLKLALSTAFRSGWFQSSRRILSRALPESTTAPCRDPRSSHRSTSPKSTSPESKLCRRFGHRGLSPHT